MFQRVSAVSVSSKCVGINKYEYKDKGRGWVLRSFRVRCRVCNPFHSIPFHPIHPSRPSSWFCDAIRIVPLRCVVSDEQAFPQTARMHRAGAGPPVLRSPSSSTFNLLIAILLFTAAVFFRCLFLALLCLGFVVLSSSLQICKFGFSLDQRYAGFDCGHPLSYD